MSTAPESSNVLQNLALDIPFVKFPPFPEPPPGVAIMPFKNFKPRGIQLFAETTKNDEGDEEDAELDALGIPTIELRIKHATDECKSSSRKKRKKKKTATAAAEGVPVKKLPWYEEWREGEDLRVTKVRYDPNIPAADRFYQSAYDFRTGRPWPSVTSGLNNLWDQFRLFTGLLVNPSVFRKAGAKKYARTESPDFESDDDDDPNVEHGEDARPAKRQRSVEPHDGDDGDENDPHKLDEEAREEKITIFLADPEKAVRIFLSSFMREHGLIWTERNLIYTPHLISFFLAFVVRNRVLPEPRYQRDLRRALEMIEWAKKELPLTHKVGQSIPDAFNEACRECFGRQGGMNWSVVEAAASVTAEQTDTGITVTDMSNGAMVNLALPTEAQMQVKDAIEDNVDMDVSLNMHAMDVSPVNENTTDEDPSNGWGDGWGDGWGNAWGSASGEDGSQNTWAQGGSWGTETQQEQETNGGDAVKDTKWADADPTWNRDPSSLFSLLGPSVFPLTHTTGIVECSTRRVLSIHFPPGHPNGARVSCPEGSGMAPAPACEGQDWMPSVEGVEAVLDAHFAKVILEPWGREEGDISGPEIWSTSRGPVIDPNASASDDAPCTVTGAGKPHDPLTDNITLLVQPAFAETLALVPGLGLAAMWIEIVRQKAGDGGGVAAAASGGIARVDEDTPGRFWYHEDVTGIFPSFYTPRAKE